ncbi:MAG: hypothetical protein BWY76_00980 [bacterium ADurb.Bin429]|nr:MAG: hypothetical protein BWY76_00980 [bacterium ADurb.Bin429]
MPVRILALLLGSLLGAAALGVDPSAPFTREVSRTPWGTFIVFHRTPATTEDLEMPLFTGALTDESFVYRVRDRKKRDVLRMARVTFITLTPLEEVATFYARALGEGMTRETNAETGEITLARGTADNLWLVVIAPKEKTCHVRQERIQQFTAPPRELTAEELRVARVYAEVMATYLRAPRIAVTVEQHTELSEAMAEGTRTSPPVLTWKIDFTRPASLTLSAAVGETLGLEIMTKDGALIVSRQGRDDETRPLDGAITLATVPELRGDPLARMVFGEDLPTDADYLALSAMPGIPPHKQVRMTLTFPEEEMVLTLLIDRQRNTVLRSEVLLTGEENRWVRTIRTYTDYHIEPAMPAPAPDGAATHRSPTEPPAMTGP